MRTQEGGPEQPGMVGMPAWPPGMHLQCDGVLRTHPAPQSIRLSPLKLPWARGNMRRFSVRGSWIQATWEPRALERDKGKGVINMWPVSRIREKCKTFS